MHQSGKLQRTDLFLTHSCCKRTLWEIGKLFGYFATEFGTSARKKKRNYWRIILGGWKIVRQHLNRHAGSVCWFCWLYWQFVQCFLCIIYVVREPEVNQIWKISMTPTTNGVWWQGWDVRGQIKGGRLGEQAPIVALVRVGQWAICGAKFTTKRSQC